MAYFSIGSFAKQLGLDGYQVVMLATGAQEKYEEAFGKLTEWNITWHYVQGSIDWRRTAGGFWTRRSPALDGWTCW